MDKDEKEMIWTALESVQKDIYDIKRRVKNIEISIWGIKQR